MPRYDYDSSDDEFVAVIEAPPRSRHGSTSGRRPNVYPTERIYVGESHHHLAVPGDVGGRHRSSSTGAQPQPKYVNINVNPERSHSHDRRRPRSRGRRSPSQSSGSSLEEIVYRDHRHHSRHPSGLLDEETIHKLDKLKMLEEQEDKREREKRIKEEVERQKLRERFEQEEKERKEKEMVEKWKLQEAAKKEKERKEKEEEDKKFKERFIGQLVSAGYTKSQAEAIFEKKKKQEHDKEKNSLVIDLSRPTWIRVHRKYLHPETLDAYYLPWEWDEKDSEYIVIKKYVSQDLQDELFEHTRRIKEKKVLLIGPVEKETETKTTLKVRGREKDQMYLVRKKSVGQSRSPGRRNFIFT